MEVVPRPSYPREITVFLPVDTRFHKVVQYPEDGRGSDLLLVFDHAPNALIGLAAHCIPEGGETK